MRDHTDAVLAAIDGALADEALPDGMRWSPEPEKVTDAAVNLYDGECVPIPPQAYEQPEDFPLIPTRRGGIRNPSLPRSNHASGLAMDYNRAPARGEVVQRDGWRFVDNRYPPEPVTCEHLAQAFAPPPDLLLVEEHGPGTVTVRRATAEDIARLFEPAIVAAVEAFRPLAAAVMEAARAFGEASRSLVPAPPAAWRAAATEEQRRDAALAHRRALGSGPPRPGPEQSHAPRRLAR
jgi:hypothetical protein